MNGVLAKDQSVHENHEAHKKKFLVEKIIDDYTVIFHIMKAKPGKEMGGSHDGMIKVAKDGEVLANIVMNTKVKYPDGSTQRKRTMKMGDWLMRKNTRVAFIILRGY